MQSMELVQLIIFYVVGINLLTIVVFWFDKWMARSGSWRIPEIGLWGLAAIGGSPGALVAMQWFHHKNKKLSFQLIFVLILLIQGGLGALAYAVYNGRIIF